MFKDHEKKIESLIRSTETDRQTITILRTELDEAKVEVAKLKSVISAQEVLQTQEDSNVNNNQEHPANTTMEEVIHSQSGDKTDSSQKQTCHACMEPNAGAQAPPSTVAPGKEKPMVTRLLDPNGKDFVTWLHKKGTPGSIPIEQQRKEQQEASQGGYKPPPNQQQQQNQHTR